MGGCPMAALALALSVAGLFGTLVSRLVREPINWQLIGCEILVTVTTVRKDFSNRKRKS